MDEVGAQVLRDQVSCMFKPWKQEIRDSRFCVWSRLMLTKSLFEFDRISLMFDINRTYLDICTCSFVDVIKMSFHVSLFLFEVATAPARPGSSWRRCRSAPLAATSQGARYGERDTVLVNWIFSLCLSPGLWQWRQDLQLRVRAEAGWLLPGEEAGTELRVRNAQDRGVVIIIFMIIIIIMIVIIIIRCLTPGHAESLVRVWTVSASSRPSGHQQQTMVR